MKPKALIAEIIGEWAGRVCGFSTAISIMKFEITQRGRRGIDDARQKKANEEQSLVHASDAR